MGALKSTGERISPIGYLLFAGPWQEGALQTVVSAFPRKMRGFPTYIAVLKGPRSTAVKAVHPVGAFGWFWNWALERRLWQS